MKINQRFNKIDSTASYKFFLWLSERDKLFSTIAHLGDTPIIVFFIILSFIIGLFSKTFLDVALISSFLMLFEAAISSIAKGMFKRPRPTYADSSEYQGILPMDVYSFPSGHASRMSALTVMAFFFNPIFGVILLLFSLAICFSRIVVGAHFIGDIIGGFILGSLSTFILLFWFW